MSLALEHLDATMTRLGVASTDWLPHWKHLQEHYAEPQRHYHSLTHIEKMVESMHHFASGAPDDFFFAIIYHDAIYDTKRSDNEELSADLANENLLTLGLKSQIRETTCRYILSTKTHLPATTIEASDMHGLFLDLDLMILGSSPEDYSNYADKIRQEYAWVPENEYRTGRAAVLQSFQRRTNLFFSHKIRALYEAQARANLKNELASLGIS